MSQTSQPTAHGKPAGKNNCQQHNASRQSFIKSSAHAAAFGLVSHSFGMRLPKRFMRPIILSFNGSGSSSGHAETVGCLIPINSATLFCEPKNSITSSFFMSVSQNIDESI